MKSIFGVFLITFALGACKPKPPELNCSFNQSSFINEIKSEFDADSVKLIRQVLKEEIYFPKLISIRAIIDNATTSILDFKQLNTDTPVKFDNFEEIENKLKEEGKKYAIIIAENCETSNLNDIIIEFGKTDKNGRFTYSFIGHYKELVKNNNR